MRERAKLLRRRLAYHRRRMQCLAKCKRDGDQPCAYTRNLQTGQLCRVTGLVKSELKPDWGPVLACDLGIPKDLKRSGDVLDPQISEVWADFRDTCVIDPSVRNPMANLVSDWMGLDDRDTPVIVDPPPWLRGE